MPAFILTVDEASVSSGQRARFRATLANGTGGDLEIEGVSVTPVPVGSSASLSAPAIPATIVPDGSTFTCTFDGVFYAKPRAEDDDTQQSAIGVQATLAVVGQDNTESNVVTMQVTPSAFPTQALSAPRGGQFRLDSNNNITSHAALL